MNQRRDGSAKHVIPMDDFETIIQQTIDTEPRYYWDAEYRQQMDQAEVEWREERAR